MLLSTASASAQTPDDYRNVIDVYASGDIQTAVSRLNRWPDDNLQVAVDRWLGPLHLPTDLQFAAAMLHTDLAAALTNIDNHRANLQLTVAHRWLGTIDRRQDRDSRAAPFMARWFEFEPSIYLLGGDLGRASASIRDGFSHAHGEPAGLLFLSGLVAEAGALRLPPRVMSGRGGDVPNPAVERLRESAATQYRRALRADQHFGVARLHLGWLYEQQRDPKGRVEIGAALTDAGDNESIRFLAHLFLGRISERDNQLANALHECEAALAAGPHFQTGYIELIRIAEAIGDESRAHEAATLLAGLEKTEDPWWNYLGGLNIEALAWLRAAARVP